MKPPRRVHIHCTALPFSLAFILLLPSRFKISMYHEFCLYVIYKYFLPLLLVKCDHALMHSPFYWAFSRERVYSTNHHANRAFLKQKYKTIG